ncbi:MAG: adenylyl-sulfate kinase [Candidatus Omnitrophica bacterium]|nr:adenylyl-sulfate kinase [Candidatus Omnitrophota bacterium]
MSENFVLWFTGLPCSGKTTIALALEKKLAASGLPVAQLDGDDLRKTLSPDLDFSAVDRMVHIRRVSILAARHLKEGRWVLVSLVSPYRQARQDARKRIGRFIEIYLRCPVEICEQRDVKGMYRSARSGRIRNFTGISDIYEEPLYPEITIDTHLISVQESLDAIEAYLETVLPHPLPARV